MGKIIKNGIEYSGNGAGTASQLLYDEETHKSTKEVVDSIKEDVENLNNELSNNYETKEDASSKLTEAKEYADSVGTTVKNDLLNGAGGAYDTLKELGDLIDDNSDAIDALEKVAASKQDAYSAITTSNIGSQSVNYANSAGSANAVAWGNVSGKPSSFTPASHNQASTTITSMLHNLGSISNNSATAGTTYTVESELVRYASAIQSHTENKTNPHGVTKAQIGLGNVDNTADSAKSVKYATSAGTAGNVTGVVGLANGGTGQTSLAALKKQIFGWTTIGSTIGTNAISFSNYANYSEMQIVVYFADCCAYTVIPASEMAVNNWYYLLPGYWGTFEASVYISNKTIKISSVKYKEQEKASSATISIYAR